MSKLVGLDGVELSSCEHPDGWSWLGVTMPVDTPMGPIPVSILYCPHCLTQRPLPVQMPSVNVNAAPPPPGINPS